MAYPQPWSLVEGGVGKLAALLPSSIHRGRRVAFIDVGTNSVRLLVVEIMANGAHSVLSRQKEVVRLGEGEFPDQWLKDAAMDRAVTVCRAFTDMAAAFFVDETIAVATSAAREAKNQAVLLARLRNEAGLKVTVVSGQEEARLVYHGIASGLNLAGETALFIDIGGGSTELAIGNESEYGYLNSLRLGAIRLSSLFPAASQGKVSRQEYETIQRYIRHSAMRVVQQARTHRVGIAVGTAGTIENLAAAVVGRTLKRPLRPDDVVSVTDLEHLIESLCNMTLEQRREVPGIESHRADIIIGGAAVIHTIMQDLSLGSLRVSDRGLREGLLIDYLSRKGFGDLVRTPARERSVVQLGRQCRFDEPHARKTAQLATAIFDEFARLKIHDLGVTDRELLFFASLLHDIGTFLTYRNHEQHSYYMIRNADLLGFNAAEIDSMAQIAYYHRKPADRRHLPIGANTGDHDRVRVRQLGLMLRMAESLDRSHAGAVAEIAASVDPKGCIVLSIACKDPCQLELWGAEQHSRAFKALFGRRVRIAPRLQIAPTTRPHD